MKLATFEKDGKQLVGVVDTQKNEILVLSAANGGNPAFSSMLALIEARPDAIRRRSIEQKLSRGLTAPAPRERPLPQVSLPEGPSQREEL